MSSSEKKTDEARARRLEIQREIHLRQLTLIQVATMAGLAALFVGCLIALLGSADQKLKDQNDAAEENLAEREAGAPAGQGKETIQAADGG